MIAQLDLFAVYVPTRTPPPRQLVATDPELWDALADGSACTLALLRRRHPGDPAAQAAALETLQGPTSYHGPVLDGSAETGARYGTAHVLAHQLRAKRVLAQQLRTKADVA